MNFASYLGKNISTSPQHEQVLAYHSNLDSEFSASPFTVPVQVVYLFPVHAMFVLPPGVGASSLTCLLHSYLHPLQDGLFQMPSYLKSLTPILRHSLSDPYCLLSFIVYANNYLLFLSFCSLK